MSNNKITAEENGQIILSPTWSPESLAFAYIGNDRQLCLYKLIDQLDRCVYQSQDDLLGALWSPDGENIALIIGECCEAEVWLVNTQSWSGVYVDTLSIAFQTSLKHEISWLQPANGHKPSLLIKAQKAFSKAILYTPDTKGFKTIDRPVLELSTDGKIALYPSGEVGKVMGMYYSNRMMEPKF